MIGMALWFAFACYGAALVLNLWQVIRAALLVDRLLALDTMTINAIALLVLYGLARGTAQALEPALLLAMFGFVATVAYCRYLLRGGVME